MSQELDPFLKLYLDNQDQKIQQLFSKMDKLEEENNEINRIIAEASADMKVAFTELKTKVTIAIAIAVFVISIVVTLSIDFIKSNMTNRTEQERKSYYNKRVSEAPIVKELREKIKKLEEE